eukprot:m.325723 g.325723  ORF g.325723 m.325723 type:complete len:118 (-) comp55564_c2_seq18:1001-1354(-)
MLCKRRKALLDLIKKKGSANIQSAFWVLFGDLRGVRTLVVSVLAQNGPARAADKAWLSKTCGSAAGGRLRSRLSSAKTRPTFILWDEARARSQAAREFAPISVLLRACCACVFSFFY